MTIHDEYLYYQEKYEKIYGKDKTIVFMMVGSFHEAYSTNERGYNLKEISDLLNIIVTKKDKKVEQVSEKNPYMLGFPSVALNKYLKVLIDDGFTVAIIDQVTPPPNPKRKVTAVYSPGTYLQENVSADANNIVCLYIEDHIQKEGVVLTCIGMSVVDLSTGENSVHESYSVSGDEKYALDEASRFVNSYNPKEIIIYRKDNSSPNIDKMKGYLSKEKLILYLELESKLFKFYEKIDSKFFKLSYQTEFLERIYKKSGMLSIIEFLDLEKKPYAIISFLLLLDFAYQHSENIVNNLFKPTVFKQERHLILGNNAVFQLNIFENNNLETLNNQFKCLFDVVNKTSTAVGKRYLRDVLNNPLLDKKELKFLYDCTDEMIIDNFYLEIEQSLKGIMDIERLNRKVSLEIINPVDFYNLINSYEEIVKTANLLRKKKHLSKLVPYDICFNKMRDFLTKCNDVFLVDKLKCYLINDIDDTIFKPGIYKEVDDLQEKIDKNVVFMETLSKVLSEFIEDVGRAKFRKKKQNSKNEEDDKKIHISRNDRDGYFLTLTKLRAQSLKNKLKDLVTVKIGDYVLNVKDLEFKQLPKGGCKIFFNDLTKVSDDLVNYREEMRNLLKDQYVFLLRDFYTRYSAVFKEFINFLGRIDYIKSNATIAKKYNYCKPMVVQKKMDNGFIRAKQLRHPIIERINQDTEYVPHDIELGRGERQKKKDDILNGILLFGLNSAGKSSCMKAIGLSVIMAQCGMYVPAQSFKFSTYDSLFARISGNDNLFKGLSSFTLEMMELRAILKRTGPKTLVIGDEVCKGTEPVSGISIVAATVINLAKTDSSFIFATHLHDIANMEKIKNLNNVKSFHLTVKYDELTDTLIFDRLLKPGSGESIYGITVAKYIIQDNDFMKLAQEIKNELMAEPNTVLQTKTSKYNSNVYVDKCSICGIRKNITGQYDTHHINFQKDCKDGFVIKKQHLPMNSKANLILLCDECHKNVHLDKIKINKYIDTSNGKKLDYKILDDSLDKKIKKTDSTTKTAYSSI